ncbi:MAG TPA: hypothetical protein VEI02_00935 [Planctomycetota bacterium]|nr:hypothetical protein [Planctomycetota bacterium]
MADATARFPFRRVVLVTLAAAAFVVVGGHAGERWRTALLASAAAATLLPLFAAGLRREVFRSGALTLLWILPAVVATVYADDPERSLFGSPYLGGGLIFVLAQAALATGVAAGAPNAIPHVRLLLAAATVALSAAAGLQRLGVLPASDLGAPFAGAVRGPFGGAAALGAFLAVATPWVHAGAFDPREPVARRKAYALLPLVAAAAIWLADVRGPMVALAAGLWVVALLRASGAKKHGRAKVFLVLGLLVLISFLGLIRGSPHLPGILLHPETEASVGRDQLDREAGRAIATATALRALVGYGLEHARYVGPRRLPDPVSEPKFHDPEFDARRAIMPDSPLAPHAFDGGYERFRSLMHETLLAQGWFGLAGFTIFLAALLVGAARRRREPPIGPLAALSAYVVHRLFNLPGAETEWLFALAAGFALRPGTTLGAPTPPPESLGSIGGLKLGLPALAALGLATLVATSFLGAIAAPTWIALGAGGLVVLMILGRPSPLSLAAAVSALGAFGSLTPPIGRAAAVDAAATAGRASWAAASGDASAAATVDAFIARVDADFEAKGFETATAAALAATPSRLEREPASLEVARRLAERAKRLQPRDRWATALHARLSGDAAALEVATHQLHEEPLLYEALIQARLARGDRAGAEQDLYRLQAVADAVRPRDNNVDRDLKARLEGAVARLRETLAR